LVEALRHKPFTPPSGNPLDRMMRSKTLVHTVDAAAEQNKPMSARLAGARTHIVVPMLRVRPEAARRPHDRDWSDKRKLPRPAGCRQAIAAQLQYL
jgi:hypothetical protein